MKKIIWLIGVLIRQREDNSPSQDSNHPDYLFQSKYVTPGFKQFSFSKRLHEFSRNARESSKIVVNLRKKLLNFKAAKY